MAKPQLALMLLTNEKNSQAETDYSLSGEYRVLIVPDSVFYSTAAPVVIHKSRNGSITTFQGYLKGWNSIYYRLMAEYLGGNK